MYILQTIASADQTNGIYPQVESMGPGYRRDDPDSVTRMRSGQPLATPPNLRSFHLDPETNLTDLVSQGYTAAAGLLASRAFCAALDGRVVQAHERWPAEVVHHGTAVPYWWLHMVEELEPRIDFARSEFTVRYENVPPERVTFAGADELDRRRRELVGSPPGLLDVRRLSFLPGTPRYDLFALLLAGRVFFVSDELAGELRARKLSGFDLVPIDAQFTFG